MDDTPELPISPTDAMNKQSLHVLRLAEQLGLPVRFRWQTDMADPNHVARQIAQVGPDNLPEDPLGIYYLYDLITLDGRQVPVVASEGEARVAMFHLALMIGGPELASQFLYRRSLMP